MNGASPGSVARSPTLSAGSANATFGRRWDAGSCWLAIAATTLGGLAVVHGPRMLAAGALPALGVMAYVLSRRISARHPSLVPVAVLLALGTVAAHGLATSELYDRLHGPLGYSNATAALYVVGIAAALILRTHMRRPVGRAALLAVALLFFTIPVGVYSRAGTVSALLVLSAAHPVWRRLGVRATIGVGVALLAAVSVGVLVVVHRGGELARLLGIDVSVLPPSVTERARLWGEGLALIRRAPLSGSGPGAFGAATGRPRLSWEHFVHNEFIQLAAEGGLLALVVVLAGIALIARQLLRSGDDQLTVLGICLLTALCLHASVDYVTRFPAVAITAMATLGVVATPVARPNRSGRPQ